MRRNPKSRSFLDVPFRGFPRRSSHDRSPSTTTSTCGSFPSSRRSLPPHPPPPFKLHLPQTFDSTAFDSSSSPLCPVHVSSQLISVTIKPAGRFSFHHPPAPDAPSRSLQTKLSRAITSFNSVPHHIGHAPMLLHLHRFLNNTRAAAILHLHRT